MKRINTIRWAVVVLLLLLPCSVVSQTQVVAITAGKLVDPETGTTLTNQVIIVEGRKIKATGPNAATLSPDLAASSRLERTDSRH